MPVTGFDQGAMPVTPGGEAAFAQGGAGERDLLANMTGMQYGDVNPWLWQMVLSQYMKDQQGQGDVVSQPFEDLNSRLATLVQQGGGPQNPNDPQAANDTISQIMSAGKTGLGGAKSISDLLRSRVETQGANDQQSSQQQQQDTSTPGSGRTTQSSQTSSDQLPSSQNIASPNYVDPVTPFLQQGGGGTGAPVLAGPSPVISQAVATDTPFTGSPGFALPQDTTFGMMGDTGGVTGAIAPGGGAAVNPGSMGADFSGGLGAAAGGLGGLAGLYSLAQAIKSGNPLGVAGAGAQTAMAAPGLISAYQYISNLLSGGGAAAGGAAGAAGAAGGAASAGGEAGIEAGVEATAGAGESALSGAAAAAGPYLSLIAPVIIGALGYMQENELTRAERAIGRKLRKTAGPQEEAAARSEGDLGNYDIANAGRQDPSQFSAYLQNAAPGFRSMDPTDANATPATHGVNYPMSALDNIAKLNAANDPTGNSGALAKSLFSPYPGVYERMAYSLSQDPNAALPSPFTSGSRNWFDTLPGTPDPRSLSTAGPSGEVIPNEGYTLGQLGSPQFASDYWQGKGVTGPEAFLYGTGKELTDTGLAGGLNLPGVSGTDFSAYDPKALYASLVAGGMPDLAASQGGGGGQPTGPTFTGPSADQGGAGGGFVRSGGQSDPEKGMPGIASANLQAALGTSPNPWAPKAPGATIAAPGSPLEQAIADAQKYLQG